MPHVFYSPALAGAHSKIWNNRAFQRSMATWERRFYGIDGQEVEGNLTAESAELPEAVAAKYPDAEYRGEGEVVRTMQMGEAPRGGR